jgi:hypothetical protein
MLVDGAIQAIIDVLLLPLLSEDTTQKSIQNHIEKGNGWA